MPSRPAPAEIGPGLACDFVTSHAAVQQGTADLQCHEAQHTLTCCSGDPAGPTWSFVSAPHLDDVCQLLRVWAARCGPEAQLHRRRRRARRCHRGVTLCDHHQGLQRCLCHVWRWRHLISNDQVNMVRFMGQSMRAACKAGDWDVCTSIKEQTLCTAILQPATSCVSSRPAGQKHILGKRCKARVTMRHRAHQQHAAPQSQQGECKEALWRDARSTCACARVMHT